MRSQLASLSSKIMSKSHSTPHRATQLHWILDWDGTLTRRDTLDALVNVARDLKPASNVSGAWKRVTQAYRSDSDSTITKLLPDGQLPRTLEAERNLLMQLEGVERRSIDRVSASGIFKGLTAEALEAGAQRAIRSGQVQLRAGVHDFLLLLQNSCKDALADGVHGISIDILSVNWSQRFISGCLKTAVPELQTKTPRYGLTKHKQAETNLTSVKAEHENGCSTNIYSNELQGIEQGRASTGVLCAKGDHKIISSADKFAYLHTLRKTNPHTGKYVSIVYVGDSRTDLECIMAAELGICIRDDPMTSSQTELRDTLQRLGVECQHIRKWNAADQGSVVWARDFTEIVSVFQQIEHWLREYRE